MKYFVFIICAMFLTVGIVSGMLGIKHSKQNLKPDQKSQDLVQSQTPSSTKPLENEQHSKQFPEKPTITNQVPTPPEQKPAEQIVPPDSNQNRGNYDEMIDAYRI
jgi:hypothetical protein